MYPFSYRLWAARIVCRELMPSLLPAACCMVDVVNGGCGRLRYGFFSTEITRKRASASASARSPACDSPSCTTPSVRAASVSVPSDLKSLDVARRVPLSAIMRDSKSVGSPSASGAHSVATTSQYGARTNAIRSRSRSTMRRVATDCTRPADRPGPTLRHSTGDSS